MKEVYEVQVARCAHDTGAFTMWESLGFFSTESKATNCIETFKQEHADRDSLMVYYSRNGELSFRTINHPVD